MENRLPDSEDIANFIIGIQSRENQNNSEEQEQPLENHTNEEINQEEVRQRRLKLLKNRNTMPPPKIEKKKEEENTPKRSQNLQLNLDKDKMEDDKLSPNMYGFEGLTPRSDQSKGPYSPSPSTPQRRKKDPSMRYQHEAISSIFKVVLQSSLDGYITLPGELLSSNHFNLEEIDSFFLEYLRALHQHAMHPFYHLVRAHSRVEKEYGSVKSRKEFKKAPTKDYRLSVLDTLRGVIVNYANLLLTYPESFLQKDPELKLTPYRLLIDGLLKDSSKNRYISRSFLAQLIEVQPSEDALKSMMNQFFYAYFEESLKLNIHDPQLETFLLILSFLLDPKQFQTKISSIFVDHPLFLNDRITNGEELENCSLLGQIFNIHATKKVEVGDSIGYMNITRTDRDYLNNKKKALRQSQIKVQLRLKEICLHLAEPAVIRPKLEKWFAAVVQLNDGRTKMIDRGTSSSEGFLSNFMVVSMMLAAPIVNKHDYSMVIPSFPMQTTDMDCLKEVAKIGTTIPNARDYYVGKPVPEFRFKTKIFFFALRSVIMGYAKSMEHYMEIMQRLEETMHGENSRDPAVLREAEIFLHHRWAYESVLYDESIVFLLFSLLEYLAKYLLFQAGYKNSINLAKEVPMDFASLPEEFIELIPRILIFLGRAKPDLLRNQKVDTFLELMIVFLNNSHYINNPYVRAKFPEAFAIFVPTERNHSNRQLLNNALSQKHLMFGIMKLYVDIEHTDSSNAFFQKFSPRFYMAQTIRGVWSVSAFRQQFKELSLTITSSADRIFLKFFNTVITDAIYLLDESLKILISIHEFEKKDDRNMFNSPRERDEAEQSLNTQQLKSSLLLANETLLMMELLSKDVPEPFKNGVMIDRVAAMMNYFLATLAGKKCQTLKVKTPEQYHFDPKKLLVTLISIYFNLSHSNPDAFYTSVFADKRSYDEVLFSKSVPDILTRIASKDSRVSSFPDRWRQFAHHIQTITSLEEDDFDDDDIPSDFEDPITYELMMDPVKLPDGSIVDRRTIETHLLNSNQNPFTKQLMTMDDVVPQPDLKQQINEWLVDMRSKKKK
mmetsp:Transcript_12838/g.19340  ORF Transcript_12838/g.19340 Transcript_12838/m.19340 type:complete len:1059 (+) Transcript_12838:65-3241(+)